MSREIKYYVYGRFNGCFLTHQETPLNPGQPFPSDEKHLINIYRGVITQSRRIDRQEFESGAYDIKLGRVHNIQINTSSEWPEENNRIFSCSSFKLLDPVISNVHVINQKTYGDISGLVMAAISEIAFGESLQLDDAEDDQGAGKNERSNKKGSSPNRIEAGGRDNNDKTNIDEYDVTVPENTGSDRGKGRSLWYKVREYGCLSRILKWVIALLLIWWIFNLSGCVKQLVCRYNKWKFEKETAILSKEYEKRHEIIEKTRPKRSQCGSQIDYEGDNSEQSFTYTLGDHSGPVIIEYNMFQVPDRIEVMYNGELVAETNDSDLGTDYTDLQGKGFANFEGTLIYDYVYKTNVLNELTIRVIPNQQVPTTRWEFKVNCP